MTPDELLARAAPAPPGPLVVALSGGPDSAVAAWVAHRLSNHPVRAVHVHHGTSAGDLLAKAAAAVAERLGLELSWVQVTVPEGASWEGRARDVRWEAILAEAGGATIVTGHHRDDLAETTLAHLIRGAGAAGLAAMAGSRPGLWRPLIRTTRRDVAGVAAALDLPAEADPANRDPAHLRNRLRHEVLPRLAAELNPQLIDALARTAHTLAADDAAIEATIDRAPLRRDGWGAWMIPAPLVATASPAVAARLVRRLLRAARPPYAGTADEVAAGLEVAGGAGRRHIAAGWQLEREGPWLVAHCGDPAPPDAVACSLPGSARFGALQVEVAPAPTVLVRRSSLLAGAAVGGELRLRPGAAGERIEIASGSKLIRDVLAEADISRRLRPAWPVVEAHGRIAAVAGIRSAPWARGAIGEEAVYEVRVAECQI